MLENARFAQTQFSVEDDYSKAQPRITFSSLLGAVRRSAGVIAAFVVIALVAAFVYLQVTPPTYNASAKIILLDAPSVAPFQQESVFAGATYNVSEVESQAALIKSDYIIKKLIETYDLTEDPRIIAPRRGMREFAYRMAEPVLGGFEVFKPLLSWVKPETVERENLFELVRDRIFGGLTVGRIGVTYVLNVEVTWDSPETAAFIANAIAQVYLADRLQRKQNEAEVATNWFNERIVELKQRAEAAEEVIETFRTENQIIDPGRQGLIIEQQIGQLRGSVLNATTVTEAALAQLTKVRQILASDLLNTSVAGISDNPLIVQLKSDLVSLGLQEAEAVRTYGQDHQVARDLRDRMTDIEQRLRDELKQLEIIYQRDYQTAQLNEQDLRGKLDAALDEAARMGASQVRLRALESEAGVYRSLYDSYLQRYLQTQQQRSFPSAEARIISEALPPEGKVGPSTSLTLGLALSAAGFLGLAVAFVRDASDKSVRTSSQLQQITGARTLGIMPKRSRRKARLGWPDGAQRTTGMEGIQPINTTDPRLSVVIDEPTSFSAETIRRLKVAVDAWPRGKTASVIGFISSDVQEGRSIVAANYAQLLAKVGRRTLLVDADVRALTLSRILAPASKIGLVDIATSRREHELGAATWVDPRTGLHFLPGRGMDPSAGSHPVVLESDRLMLSLSLMAKSYDSIVIDLAALTEAADAAAIEKFVDGFVLVAAWGATNADSLERALATPRIDPEKIVGALLDDVDLSRFGTYEKLH